MKRFGYIIVTFVVLSGIFYLGFLYGQRQSFNQADNQIEVVAGNQARRNSLSDIQVLDIWGAVSNKKTSGFGQLYFKVGEGKTEILVRLQNTPLKVTGASQNLDLPSSLRIETASLTTDGLNYDYESIGTINLNEPTNGVRGGEFSTTLNYSIFEPGRNIQRIVIKAGDAQVNNFFLDEDPNLPAQARREPAPFFWVVL